MSHIFLSYAHKDLEAARRLYAKITAAGYPVWFDKESLMVGQTWENEISRAISSSLAFIALISHNSVDHRGIVQKELQQGLDEYAKTPANQVYMLPVRINDASPTEPRLEKIHWLDLFPDEDAGIRKLLKVIATIAGLVTIAGPKPPVKEATTPEVPRFESMSVVFRAVLQRIPPATPESGAVNAFYVKVKSQREGVEMPQALRQRYPEEILFVFEHQYKDLVCDPTSFSVTLWFSGVEARVTVPYKAITEMAEPNAHIRIA
jgi:hypothetical protein